MQVKSYNFPKQIIFNGDSYSLNLHSYWYFRRKIFDVDDLKPNINNIVIHCF